MTYAEKLKTTTTTKKDRKSKSKYNTYRYKGLPPGPISAPGKAALEAAANPEKGKWLYFVTVNLDTGETKFAETRGAREETWRSSKPGARPTPADVAADLRSLGGVRRCAVVGSPIEHSLSPALHRAAYAQLGLNWTYDRVEVDEHRLASFVAGLDGSWRGLSLTMPLKVAVLELGQVDELAKLAGAANTLVLEGGERWVYNTDVGGLTWAVQQVAVRRCRG